MNLEAARARAVFERTRVHIGERYRCPIANVSLYFIETQPLIEVRYMKESYTIGSANPAYSDCEVSSPR